MLKVATNSHFILDGIFVPNDHNHWPEMDTSGFLYEVIRVIHGVPLFFREHMERFQQSFSLANTTPLYPFSNFDAWSTRLIQSLAIDNGNIKLLQSNHPEPHALVYQIAHHYPTEKERQGIAVRPFSYTRINPQAKIFRSEFRQEVARIQQNEKLFEVLLVDDFHHITEGSRSNVFFVKDHTLYTPPSHAVLEGITRKMILRAAKNISIPIVESPIAIADLATFDGAFLSGTSIDVLPVSRIGDHHYLSKNESVIVALSQAYEALKAQDLMAYQTK